MLYKCRVSNVLQFVAYHVRTPSASINFKFNLHCFQEEEERQKITPEEEAAERLRQRQIQEESDLMLAKEAFGTSLTVVLRHFT